MHVPLFNIFKPGLLGNTLTACWWMASSFLVYYSINALFATHLQKDLNLSPALVATPVALANLAVFLARLLGLVRRSLRPPLVDDHPCGHRDLCRPPLSADHDFTWIAVGFVLQGFFGAAIYGQNPAYLSERFPTEVRATASAFCYHQGAIFGGFVPLVLT